MKTKNSSPLASTIIKALHLLLLVTFAVTSQAAVESTTYIITDHLGSPILATDEDGQVKWQEDYQPYGTQIIREDTDNTVGFTGHRDDKALDVTYMQGRWYHPEMGRFMAIDPVGFVEGNPQSFNRYAYVSNNPYRFVDPDGENAVAAFGGLLVESYNWANGNGFDGAQVLGALYDGYNGEGDGVASAAFDDATSFVPVGTIIGTTGKIVKLSKSIKVTGGLAGLSKGQAKAALRTAQEAYKGTTRVGHALSKHAGRNPNIWGKVTGSQKTWNDQAMKHMREIFRGPGEFSKVTNDKGITFLEKHLSDGRGMRLNLDYTFKGFLD